MRRVVLLLVGIGAVVALVGCGGDSDEAASTTSTVGTAEARWVITDLGTLGGEESVAHAINDRGQIVGEADTESGAISRAFLWENGTMRDLGTLGGKESSALAINERGQVVGWADTDGRTVGEPIRHAFLWFNGKMSDLGALPGGRDSEAYAINERGHIVGLSEVGGGVYHAFLWQNGKMRDLGTLGGAYSEASAINEDDQVVGEANTGAKGTEGYQIMHAFLWQNGKMRDLGALGGEWSWARAINDRGEVVGHAETKMKDEWSKYRDPIYHAFLWQKGTMRDLADGDRRYSSAHAINERGQIVGAVTPRGGAEFGPPSHAAVWHSGKLTKLPSLPGGGGLDSDAVAVNSRGHIVGHSEIRPGELYVFSRAVLWTLKR